MAAGTLKKEESVMQGFDGRSYKSRTDVIDIDAELTEALHVTRDPIMPLVDDIKQSRSRQLTNDIKHQNSGKTSARSSQSVGNKSSNTLNVPATDSGYIKQPPPNPEVTASINSVNDDTNRLVGEQVERD